MTAAAAAQVVNTGDAFRTATFSDAPAFLAAPSKSIPNLLPEKGRAAACFDFQRHFEPHFLQLVDTDHKDPATLLPDSTQWESINQMRIYCGAPQPSEHGVERLLQYYTQLLYLDRVVAGTVVAPFAWRDAFNTSKVSTLPFTLSEHRRE